MALAKPPRPISSIVDVPDVLDFPRDIQPILDRHCVECHNPDRREGNVDLCGDHTPKYSISYRTIIERGLIADGRNQPYANRVPRTIGSSASRLMTLLDGSHYDAKPTPHQRKTVRLWIEASATYPGTYASLGCGMYHVPIPNGTLSARCGSCHRETAKGKPVLKFGDTTGVQSLCNLTRPEKSHLLLAPLSRQAGGLGRCAGEVFVDAQDADYQKLLAAIVATAKTHDQEKRFDMRGFRPNKYYICEMQRFDILPKQLDPDSPIDVYKTDQEYWKSFWYRPAP